MLETWAKNNTRIYKISETNNAREINVLMT